MPHMRLFIFIPLCFSLSLAGCLDDQKLSKREGALTVLDSRIPVDKLSFDELQRVTEDCQKTGKIVTDNYCKEAGYVFQKKDWEKREQNRLDRARKESYPTKGFDDH
jgi:hypothetical protein